MCSAVKPGASGPADQKDDIILLRKALWEADSGGMTSVKESAYALSWNADTSRFGFSAAFDSAGPFTYCNSHKCNADAKCVWCKSAAIPSSCYTIADSKKLPPGVFECDAKASPSTVVFTYHMLPDCSDKGDSGIGTDCGSIGDFA